MPPNTVFRLLATTLLTATTLLATPAHADPVRIFAAGSLGADLPKLIAASGLPPETVAPPTFGPAGALGQRLQGPDTADLFASADLTTPQAVTAAKGGLVVPFARNRMCVLAKATLALTSETLLDRLLDPSLRLATSTPGNDPGGDYAQALFARADIARPGARTTLQTKSTRPLGGPGSMTPAPGLSPAATIIAGGHADALLYYCSATDAAAKEAPRLVSLPVPETLEVHPTYGLAILSENPAAARLALFILSERGQSLLTEAGLLPLIPTAPQ